MACILSSFVRVLLFDKFFYSVKYAIIVILVIIVEITGVVLAALMKKDVSIYISSARLGV